MHHHLEDQNGILSSQLNSHLGWGLVGRLWRYRTACTVLVLVGSPKISAASCVLLGRRWGRDRRALTHLLSCHHFQWKHEPTTFLWNRGTSKSKLWVIFAIPLPKQIAVKQTNLLASCSHDAKYAGCCT